MALWVCSGCSTRYAPGLESCPHCGGGERVEEGSGSGSRLPFLDVFCPTVGCRAEGVVRRVHRPMIVSGVVEQSTYQCVPCGAVMLPVAGWPAPAGMEENMPKITRHGGPTNAADQPPAPPAPAEPVETPADDSPPPADDVAEHVEKPRGRRTRKKAADATAELTVTAEAEVTRGDTS